MADFVKNNKGMRYYPGKEKEREKVKDKNYSGNNYSYKALRETGKHHFAPDIASNRSKQKQISKSINYSSASPIVDKKVNFQGTAKAQFMRSSARDKNSDRSFVVKPSINSKSLAFGKKKSKFSNKYTKKIKSKIKVISKSKITQKGKDKANEKENGNHKKFRRGKDDRRKSNTFVYRIDYADPQRKRAKTSLARELFLVKTKLLKFYNNIKKDQIRRYANTKTFKIKFKAARGYTNKALLKYSSKNTLQKRLALNAFFSLVEHRLDVLLFRSNFVSTMLEARQLINHCHVLVNEHVVTHTGYMLNNFDVISVASTLDKKLRMQLFSNVKKKRVTLYPPKYIYVDYRLMRSTLISNPLVRQIPFPFKIDLRKWLGLAKYMF